MRMWINETPIMIGPYLYTKTTTPFQAQIKKDRVQFKKGQVEFKKGQVKLKKKSSSI